MKSIRKLIALVLVLSFSCAFAEEFPGKTAFLTAQTVYSDFEGTIENVYLETGRRIISGERTFSVKTERMYADFDGTIRGLIAEEGKVSSGEIFVLEPKEKYKLLASVSYAYDKAENKFVHAGETVYISCVKDATHLAIGYIGQITGNECTVYTTHGTLYIGEAVNVFRSSDRNYMSRIGRATVYAADNTIFEMDGRPVKMYIREGDRVERGEMLMEYLPGADAPRASVLTASSGGIVTQIHVSAGDSVSKGDKLFDIAQTEDLGFSFEASQADMTGVFLGANAEASFLIDPDEKALSAAVFAVVPLSGAEDARYEVLLKPDAPLNELRAGLSVRIDFGNMPE